MNPHQAPINTSGTYNNHPQQQTTNVLNSMYQQPVYQAYTQQYISPAQPMVGYHPVYQPPQANPLPNMGNVPQRDLIPGNQHNQMIQPHHSSSMHNQQLDVLSNIQEPYHQNSIQWPPRPFPNDPQFFQYPSNQNMYMPRPTPPATQPPPPPSPPLQQLNQPQIRPPFYPPYQSNSLQQQQISSHSTAPPRSFQNPNFKNSKKSNAHQTVKNQNKSTANNNNHSNSTHNQSQTVNQPKSKNKAKKQKKQSGHDSKKQSGRDTSSIDRIPTSSIVEKQCQKWGWVLPPLPHRSLNSKTNASSNARLNADNSNSTENHTKTGFTFSLKSLNEMDNQEEEEINNENNEDNNDDDDDILYNDNSEDNDNSNNNNNNNNSDDTEDDGIYNDDDGDNENELFSNSDNNSDENNESINNEEQQANSNEYSDLFDKYRDNPIKRTLFLWDEIFKT